MANEFDDACETEILRRAGEPDVGLHAGRDRSRAARLVARIYAGATAIHRPELIGCLLRPLGPLAVVGVASGAFAAFLGRVGGRGPGIALEEIARVSNEQILELARFVEQVSPDALAHVATTIAESPAGISSLTVAATLLLMRAVRGAEPRRAMAATAVHDLQPIIQRATA